MLVPRRALPSALARVAHARSYAATSSGVFVYAQDHGQPTTSITVLVKAGSRYEPETGAGLAHVLKNFGFKSTAERSSLRTVREAELYGGILSATLSREYIGFSADFLRGDESFFLPLLASQISSPKFSPHELREHVFPLTLSDSQQAVHDGSYTALELAHALAFREGGLGRALLAHPQAHSPSIASVIQFAQSAYTAGNIAVIGSGISQSTLEKLVSDSPLSGSSTGAAFTPKPTKYGGGSSIVPSVHPTLFIGFGAAGEPTPGIAALAAHLAPSPKVPWTDGLSPLSQLPGSAKASAYLLPYSDATLFGILIHAKASKDLRPAGEAVVKALKEVAAGGVKSELVGRAKAMAKFNAALAEDGRAGVLAAGKAKWEGKGESKFSAEVDKLDAKAIGKFTTDLLKTKPTYVALGDINVLPQPEELGL